MLRMLSIYTLTSQLHDEKAIAVSTQEFLTSLGIQYELKGADYSDYGTSELSLIFVRTGGTEAEFKEKILPLLRQMNKPAYLLASNTSNSLAASLEILSYLRKEGLQGEILHGSQEYIQQRILKLHAIHQARQQLHGQQLGIIGKPSDWLIASEANANEVRRKLGIELVEIAIDEVVSAIGQLPIDGGKEGAMRIYEALKNVVEKHQLQGFTIRCFDLLGKVHNTGCLALAKLNSEGLVAGCEGDVPAMLSMAICRALFGISGFQANPAQIDVETGQITLAHCTIPLDMVERYELDTHFESGIGVGIRGFMALGPVTLFKVSGDLSRQFIAEGTLLRNESRPDRCRTQLVIQLDDPAQAQYFLTNPIGNHHIILPGRKQDQLQTLSQPLP